MTLLVNVLNFLKLVRAPNLLIIFFTQWMVRYFLIVENTHFPEPKFYLLSLSTVLMAAAGYIINDYYDVKIDLINKPDQLVIGRNFSRRHAITAHLVLNFLGVAAGLFVYWKIAIVNVLCGLLLWLYSNRLKQLPLLGNLAVSALTSLSIIVLTIYYKQPNSIIFLFALYAFFITLIREIVKDVEDMKGDMAFGCRTLPIELGLRKTKIVIYVVISILIVLYVLLSIVLDLHAISYLGYSGILAMMLLYLTLTVFKADTKKEFSYLSQYTKIIMLVGVLGIAFI